MDIKALEVALAEALAVEFADHGLHVGAVSVTPPNDVVVEVSWCHGGGGTYAARRRLDLLVVWRDHDGSHRLDLNNTERGGYRWMDDEGRLALDVEGVRELLDGALKVLTRQVFWMEVPPIDYQLTITALHLALNDALVFVDADLSARRRGLMALSMSPAGLPVTAAFADEIARLRRERQEAAMRSRNLVRPPEEG